MYTITERKNRVLVVPRKTLRIKAQIERTIANGSVGVSLWAGKSTGALSFSLTPQSSREAAVVLAKLREALPGANPDFVISVVACESTVRRGSLQFSYQRVNYRDQ